MALDAATVQELIRELNAERNAYLESFNRTHELLLQAITSVNPPAAGNRLTTEAIRRNTTANIEVETLPRGSIISGADTSDLDENESLFVQVPLETESYDLEGFRHHVMNYKWSDAGQKILGELLHDTELLKSPSIFPTSPGEVEDRSHFTHYSIFDVGQDGSPLEIRSATDTGRSSRAMAIWNRLKSVNADTERERKAVGRITIVREPSQLLYAALHYTMSPHFDVDELFQLLVDDDPALAHPHRAFAPDHRHRRSFVFTLEYFTIIGEGCVPPSWQRADENRDTSDMHIPISRCSSVVALSLQGDYMTTVRNKDRRKQHSYGEVFDPFSPWHVLSITAHPDWQSSVDAHDSTKHYVNGPEAFLVTLRAEFKDAGTRLMEVHKQITDLVEPPPDFIFRLESRDKLLFEDSEFTMSRRYFWAYNALGIMNQDIQEMVTSYEETFKDAIWNGTHKVIWPGDEAASSRHSHWRKRMGVLRADLEAEVKRLQQIELLNVKKMKTIKGLHDSLFSGTSVFESRKSVEQAEITVQQGRNIKLLTLITIFFLPLTFVTSVFGMTNMPPNMPFYHFAYSTIAVCIPTYLIIGILNTPPGVKFCNEKTRALLHSLGFGLAWTLRLINYKPTWARHFFERPEEAAAPATWRRRRRGPPSFEGGIAARETWNGMPVLSPRDTARPGPPARRSTTLETIERADSPASSEPGGYSRVPRRPTSSWPVNKPPTSSPTSPMTMTMTMGLERTESPIDVRTRGHDWSQEKLECESEFSSISKEREGSMVSKLFKGRRTSKTKRAGSQDMA